MLHRLGLMLLARQGRQAAAAGAVSQASCLTSAPPGHGVGTSVKHRSRTAQDMMACSSQVAAGQQVAPGTCPAAPVVQHAARQLRLPSSGPLVRPPVHSPVPAMAHAQP